jgi:ubiquinone/menaquinone biosynthesis C-methylase UbiE
MPFEYSSFDALVDFSTIDHIHDYRVALKEYGRVVKNGGIVLITVWTSKDKQDVSSDPEVYTLDPTGKHRQYYFDADEFMESILATGNLRVQDAGVYPHFITGERRLSWFHCVVYK